MINYLQFTPEEIEESPELPVLIGLRDEFIQQVITTYISEEAYWWLVSISLASPGQSSRQDFQSDYGRISLSLNRDEKNGIRLLATFIDVEP